MTPPRRRTGSGAALHVGVIGFYLVVAVAFTWPLARHVRSTYPVWEVRPAPGADQLLTSWILATDARQLLRDPAHAFESNNFHPFRRTLAFSENLFGLAVPLVPLQARFDNPVLTDNVATLLSLALAGWGVFLLVRELTESALAAVTAGVLVVYTPSKWSDLSQLHMIAGHWTPIALFAWLKVMRTRALGWVIALGAAVAAQAWTSLHWGLFLGLALGVATPIMLILSRDARRAFPQLVVAGALGIALCLPLVLEYRTLAWEWDLQRRSTFPAFFWPTQGIPPFRHPISYLRERLVTGTRIQSVATLTPWTLAVLGGAAGLLLPRRPRRLDLAVMCALTASACFMFLFSLGLLPFFWLPPLYPLLAAHVPGLGIVRAPVRGVNVSYLVLCVGAGCGLAALLRRLRPRPLRAALVAAVVTLAVLETGWRGVFLAPPPAVETPISPEIARLPPDCAIAELPADFWTGAVALFRSTAHWRPLINGYSGFYGIEPWTSYWFLNQFPKPAALDYLRQWGACAVVVRSPEMVTTVAPEAAALGFQTHRAGDELLVRLPPAPPPAPLGPRFPRAGWFATGPAGSASAVLDGDVETFWTASTTTAPAPEQLTVDMGRAAPVAAIEIALGRHLRSYLVSYRVEGSVDGQRWDVLAEASLAVPPVASYRANPADVRQRITFPPATIRWFRIGPHHAPPSSGFAPDVGWSTWSVGEVEVYAPAPDAAAGLLHVPEGAQALERLGTHGGGGRVAAADEVDLEVRPPVELRGGRTRVRHDEPRRVGVEPPRERRRQRRPALSDGQLVG